MSKDRGSRQHNTAFIATRAVFLARYVGLAVGAAEQVYFSGQLQTPFLLDMTADFIEDAELSALAVEREKAERVRAERKLILDSCFQNLKSVRARVAFEPSVDRLAREGDQLHLQMAEAFGVSKACYEMRDHEGAGYWSKQGRALEARLNEVNREKNRLISTIIGPARASFDEARDNYREAKANHETAEEKFTARRKLLEERSKERTREKTRRVAEAKGFQRFSDTQRFKELAIVQAKKELQFLDEDIRVQVRLGYDKNYGCYVTNIYVFHRDKAFKRHLHVIRDFDGRELMSAYRDDAKQSLVSRLLRRRNTG